MTAKEKTEEAVPEVPAELEGQYHGYTPEQIERIKAAKDPAPAAPSKESEAVKMPEPEKVKSSDVRTGSPPDDEDDKKGKK